MAGVISSTNSNNNMLLTFLQRRMLVCLQPKAHFYQLAEKYALPNQSGVSMVFSQWRRVVPASSTLNQSASNEPVALSSRKVTATLAQYGRHCNLTDLSESTLISSPTQGAIERLMNAMALTVDNVIQLSVFKNVIGQVGKDGADTKAKILSAYMSAVASALCANTGTGPASNQFGLPAVFAQSAARLSAVDRAAPSISARFGPIGIRKAVSRLQSFDAEPYADGYFYGILHPKAVSTAWSNDELKRWYVGYKEGTSQMFKGEVLGPIHGVKFLVSSNVPRFCGAGTGNPHSCHLTPILGREAVGCVELDGGTETIIKRVNNQNQSDPYNLIAATVAFKVKMAAAVLNPSAGCILISHEGPGA